MYEVIKNMEWHEAGTLYYTRIGYDSQDNKIFLYSNKPQLPQSGEIMQYGNAILLIENGKHPLKFLRVKGNEVRKVEGVCKWFASSFTLDLETNSLTLIVIGNALIEVKNGNEVYMLEVTEVINEYPGFTIEGFHKIKG
jgi:hypothetical protein